MRAGDDGGGIEVADRLRRGIPGTTFALETTSGFGKEPAFMERHALPEGMQVLTKPFPVEAMAARIRQMIQA